MNKQLVISDPAWLEKVQAERHITLDTLKAVGVPVRYQNLVDRKDRTDACSNLLLTSQKDATTKAKEVLTDYVVSALNHILPGLTIKAITFTDLIRTLSYTVENDERVKLYSTDVVFIYDFGLFGLRDWEQAALTKFIMSRYNSLQHIALATENLTHTAIAQRIGTDVWDIVTDYCLCREVE